MKRRHLSEHRLDLHRMRAAGWTNRDIARHFGVSGSAIGHAFNKPVPESLERELELLRIAESIHGVDWFKPALDRYRLPVKPELPRRNA